MFNVPAEKVFGLYLGSTATTFKPPTVIGAVVVVAKKALRAYVIRAIKVCCPSLSKCVDCWADDDVGASDNAIAA